MHLGDLTNRAVSNIALASQVRAWRIRLGYLDAPTKSISRSSCARVTRANRRFDALGFTQTINRRAGSSPLIGAATIAPGGAHFNLPDAEDVVI